MAEARFQFGNNWRAFLHGLSPAQIEEAEGALRALLGRDSLAGSSFLDIGSGSGLHSLAARRLGARVHSFDFDPESVACGKDLRAAHCPGDPAWSIEQGSVLDKVYMDRLGRFDIVYSWGVLHHTGALHSALRNAAAAVARDGLFAFAIYRRTLLCPLWRLEKRWYANASPRGQARARALYRSAFRLGLRATGRDFATYVADYTDRRGMDYERDLHDWLGGYPYESMRPGRVDRVMAELGLEPVRRVLGSDRIGWLGSGCDQYVFRRV